jgi:DNA mismatch endonuclease (patch repair protein)
MPDIFTKEKRSEVMSRIRGKNTKPELVVFRYLRREKIYFQKHYKKAPGSPDVALPRKRIAVLIDGDFWHGRHYAKKKEKLPEVYWQGKIAANIARDKRNMAKLRRSGWRVMRVWESDLMGKRQEKTLEKVRDFLIKPT